MSGPSYAAVTPANMELTPSRFKFGGVDLGGTLGNVAIKPVYEKAEIKADQFGSSVLDRRVKGVKITIETQLTEVKNKDNWMVVFPHLRDATSGSRVLDFVSKVGESDLALAKELLIHPLSLADSDVSGDFFAWKATAEAASDYTLGPDGQTTLKVLFNLYLDTSVTPARLARLGDKDIVITSGSGIAALANLIGANPIVLTSAILGASRNTQTFTTHVSVAAANPTNLVIATVSGTLAAISLTIIPNDGTNNTATPVSITEAQLVELINTGVVVGKNVALNDPSGLLADQTARVFGAGSTSLAHSGAIDGAIATFAGGVD